LCNALDQRGASGSVRLRSRNDLVLNDTYPELVTRWPS